MDEIIRLNYNCNGGFNFTDIIKLPFDEFMSLISRVNMFVEELNRKQEDE